VTFKLENVQPMGEVSMSPGFASAELHIEPRGKVCSRIEIGHRAAQRLDDRAAEREVAALNVR